MTDEGPRMANLSLDGIMKDGVTTESHQKFWRSLVFEEYFPKGTNLEGKKLTLPLRNAFDFEIKGRLSWIVPPSSPWEVKGYSDEIFTMAPGRKKAGLHDPWENRWEEESPRSFAQVDGPLQSGGRASRLRIAHGYPSRQMSLPDTLKEAARELARTVNALSFDLPTAYVYNPLDYAWEIHRQYLELAGGSKKNVVFLGMNPGPFGMAQTGVPFGEIPAVRDWMGLRGEVEKPEPEHPKRPVEGLACAKERGERKAPLGAFCGALWEGGEFL